MLSIFTLNEEMVQQTPLIEAYIILPQLAGLTDLPLSHNYKQPTAAPDEPRSRHVSVGHRIHRSCF